jgi:hypothetical protein
VIYVDYTLDVGFRVAAERCGVFDDTSDLLEHVPIWTTTLRENEEEKYLVLTPRTDDFPLVQEKAALLKPLFPVESTPFRRTASAQMKAPGPNPVSRRLGFRLPSTAPPPPTVEAKEYDQAFLKRAKGDRKT